VRSLKNGADENQIIGATDDNPARVQFIVLGTAALGVPFSVRGTGDETKHVKDIQRGYRRAFLPLALTHQCKEFAFVLVKNGFRQRSERFPL